MFFCVGYHSSPAMLMLHLPRILRCCPLSRRSQSCASRQQAVNQCESDILRGSASTSNRDWARSPFSQSLRKEGVTRGKDSRRTRDSHEETQLTSRCQYQCHAQRDLAPEQVRQRQETLVGRLQSLYSSTAGHPGHSVDWRPQNMRHRTSNVGSPLVRASQFRLGTASPPGDWPLHVVCGNRKVQPGVQGPPIGY